MTRVPTAMLDQAAERFRLLSDPTRLRLLNELDMADEIAVGEIAERAGVGLSNTSKHLHQLERAGLVGRRRVAAPPVRDARRAGVSAGRRRPIGDRDAA
jgi:DNA-binding transcriptional ArsR family regulator